MPRLAWTKSDPASAWSIRCCTSPASSSSSDGSAGSCCTWRSVCRTVPASREAWNETSCAAADHQLGRAAADVDHQRLLAGAAVVDRAEIGEPRLVVPAEHAGVEREPLAQLAGERAAVLGVAHRRGGDRDDALGVQLLVASDVLGDRRADVLDRLRRELARRVDAAPEPRHGRAPVELGQAPALDVGDQQPGRVRAHVDHRDPHRRSLFQPANRAGTPRFPVLTSCLPPRGGAVR